MALTISNLKFDIAGVSNVVRGTIGFDSSYATGGESLTPAMLGLSVIDQITVVDAAGYSFEYDYTNRTLRAYRSAGFTPAGTVAAPTFTGAALAAHTHALHFNNADVADGAGTRVNIGTDLLGANTGADVAVAGVADTSGHGGVLQVTAGTPAGTNSAPAFTGSAVAAAALVEVSNATDLSSLTGVRFRAEGV